LQHLLHRTDAHEQRQSTHCQIALQLGHAVQQEADVARVALGARQPLRLDHHQAERTVAVHGFGQRGMVAHAKVALEPDQCCGRHDTSPQVARRCGLKAVPAAAITAPIAARAKAPNSAAKVKRPHERNAAASG
jgi:hypothetical protein